MITFIRPEALYLLPIVLLILIWQLTQRSNVEQQSPLAPHLAKFLLEGQSERKKQNTLWLILFLLLSIFALAGPSWQSQPLPVYQTKQARVIVMDMSRSMYSEDIKPNRLTQARFKVLSLTDILKESDLALVAYSSDAYTISPLTSDHQTLANLIPSLSPEIMPVPGSNAFAGINSAVDLLSQAGVDSGEIYWITDGIDSYEEGNDIVALANKHNIKINIYTVATEQGAPIQLPNEGFLKDNYGQIVIPKANFSQLKRLAERTNGVFSYYQISDSDLNVFTPKESLDSQLEKRDQTSEQPIDGGIYLLFVLLPLAFMMLKNQPQFLTVICCLCLFTFPQPSVAFSLPDWLLNKEQKAQKAYDNKDYDTATASSRPNLAGSAHYQTGNYEAALDAYQQDSSAIGHYNRGNALAKLNKLQEAIDAYDAALERQPDLQPAIDNKKLLEDLLNQQQNSQNSDQSQQSDEQNQEQQEGDQQQNDQQSSQNGEQSNNDQSEKDSQQSSEQQNQQSESKNSQSNNQNDAQNNQPEMQADAKNNEQQEEQESQQSQPQQQQTPAPSQTEPKEGKAMPADAEPLTPEEKEKMQVINQLLRKVPDDPAILLRNKMKLESQKRYRQRIQQQGVEKSW